MITPASSQVIAFGIELDLANQNSSPASHAVARTWNDIP
jgi:hypothetical protein